MHVHLMISYWKAKQSNHLGGNFVNPIMATKEMNISSHINMGAR
jgi:hypothetical protein